MSAGAARPPSVERLLAAVRPRLATDADPDALATIARDAVDAERERLRAGAKPTSLEALADEVAGTLAGLADPDRTGLVPVINATGVILHTNLGRAPWAEEAIEAARQAAAGYSLLELDRGAGRRGPRFRTAEAHLVALTGAEDAIVTVNNAAAVALAVGLAGRSGVAVSRGELVEIGGSFRVPEILAKSGAVLREVGTTNRTRLADYERALGPRTALLLKVHPSNYKVVGFTAAVPIQELATLARRTKRPLLMDQGSGNLIDLAPHGVRDEPTVQEALAAGADVVCFSADKLLGGPQAGLLIGRPALIERMRANPLARALRPDKMIFAALENVLRTHVRGAAPAELPVLRMITLPPGTIEGRARRLVDGMREKTGVQLDLSLRPGRSVTGGGSAPGEGLPTTLVAVRSRGAGAQRLEERLRRRPIPVIARVEAGELLLDLRTVPEEQDALLAEALAEAASAEPPAAAAPGPPLAPVRR
jgi:L-seryl-tRNA(Ser) seleniumtransferase